MKWINDKYTLRIESFESKEWQYIVDVLAGEPGVTIWESSKINAYRYNIALEMAESSIYMCYWHNSQTSMNMGLHSLKIEFNFNKCKGERFFHWLCETVLYSHMGEIFVRRVDMCTDIKTSISNFVVDKGRKKNVRTYNDTMYFGASHKNGFVKIYNKAKEMGSDEVLTRYEVTIMPYELRLNSDELFVDYTLVETMVLDTWQLGFELDAVDRMVITSIMDGNGYLNELNRRYRKKIKDIMAQMTSLKIDNSSIGDINKAILSEKQSLINYITMIHNKFTFGNIEEIPF